MFSWTVSLVFNIVEQTTPYKIIVVEVNYGISNTIVLEIP